MQQLAQRGRHRLFDLETHDGAPRSPLHLLGYRLEEARRRQLVELDVPGARDPEGVGGHHLPAGEQGGEPRADQRLQRHDRARGALQPGHRGRELDDGEVLRPARLVPQDHGQAQAPVAAVRERVPRGARQRLGREQGRDLLGETPVERAALVRPQLVPITDPDPVRRQLAARQIVEAAVLPRHDGVETDRDGVQLLGWGEAVRRALADPGGDPVLQGPDFDHEELIEVRAHDREKAEPSQERRPRVFRERQHARVEFERAQVRVDELLGGGPVRLERSRRERGHAELAERDAAAVVARGVARPPVLERRR